MIPPKSQFLQRIVYYPSKNNWFLEEYFYCINILCKSMKDPVPPRMLSRGFRFQR
jgi:hypothetical protein